MHANFSNLVNLVDDRVLVGNLVLARELQLFRFFRRDCIVALSCTPELQLQCSLH